MSALKLEMSGMHFSIHAEQMVAFIGELHSFTLRIFPA